MKNKRRFTKKVRNKPSRGQEAIFIYDCSNMLGVSIKILKLNNKKDFIRNNYLRHFPY